MQKIKGNYTKRLRKKQGNLRQENVKPALKPDGRLVIIEHTPEKTENSHHNMPKEMVLKQAKEAGFKSLRIETFLKFDNIYIFKKE